MIHSECFLDVDVILQEETEGEEDDQEQSIRADGEAAQVLFSPEIYLYRIFAILVCLLQTRVVIVNNIGSASEGQV